MSTYEQASAIKHYRDVWLRPLGESLRDSLKQFMDYEIIKPESPHTAAKGRVGEWHGCITRSNNGCNSKAKTPYIHHIVPRYAAGLPPLGGNSSHRTLALTPSMTSGISSGA